jgi:hypothetical protein
MSAIGTKQTLQSRPRMSAFGGKADIAIALRKICFDPKPTWSEIFSLLRSALSALEPVSSPQVLEAARR